MLLLDANLLVYAVNRNAPHHRTARAWLERTLSGDEAVAVSWTVLLAFLRLTTHPRILDRPLTVNEAIAAVDDWLAAPLVRILEPTPEHWVVFKRLLADAGTGGNLTTDAHLAALAIEHGSELCSTDTDFARFKGLRWSNPLS
jgi:uncharacterized protein